MSIPGSIVLMMLGAVPMLGLWIWHVQQMAKLRAKNGENMPTNELAQCQSEITELRQMITSLAINVENMKDNKVHGIALEDRMKVGE